MSVITELSLTPDSLPGEALDSTVLPCDSPMPDADFCAPCADLDSYPLLDTMVGPSVPLTPNGKCGRPRCLPVSYAGICMTKRDVKMSRLPQLADADGGPEQYATRDLVDRVPARPLRFVSSVPSPSFLLPVEPGCAEPAECIE